MTITIKVTYSEASNASPDLLVMAVSPAITPYGYCTPEVENGVFKISKPIDGFVVEPTDEPLAAWRIEELIRGIGITVLDTSYGRIVIRRFTNNLCKGVLDPNHLCCFTVRPVYNTCHTGMCFDHAVDRRFLLEIIGGHGLLAVSSSKENVTASLIHEIETRMSGLWFIDAVVPATEYLHSVYED